MPAPYLGSPSDRRSKAIRDQRVSFNIGGGSSKLPEDPFSGSSSSSFAVPGPVNRKHQRHPSFASTSQGAQKAARRARVEDVEDSEDDSDEDAKAKPNKDKGKGKSLPVDNSTAPADFPFSQPPGSSTAAYNTLINPALGPNAIYTHQYQAPPQNYNIQALPTFIQPGNPFPMATMDPYSGATGINFFPAVPDATNGPMMHTYVPRNDPPGVGSVYMQHMGGFPGQVYPGAPIATSTAPVLPIMQQPMYAQQPPMAYGGNGGGGGCGQPPIMMMPGNYPGEYPGMVHPEPALGVGQTPAEVMQEQLEFAYTNNMNEPQDFKPADDDPSRFYWVREIDGAWTQRSRATIDHIGCRWYISDSGVFYAVRLPD